MKPHVICHMITSVDGRIVTSTWNLSQEGRKQYEQTAATYDVQAWMCGRITMAAFANGTAPQKLFTHPLLEKSDFIAQHDASSFAIALDPRGKLYWHTNAIDGDHVIAILTEQVDAGYLAFLQSQGVSYLFAGKEVIDLVVALDKLATKFHITKLLLEGGGKINGSLLQAGLIDELSVLIAPIADGSTGTPTLFDTLNNVSTSPASMRLTLLSMEQRADGIVWLRYRCS